MEITEDRCSSEVGEVQSEKALTYTCLYEETAPITCSVLLVPCPPQQALAHPAHKYFIETWQVGWIQSTEKRNSTFGWNYHKFRIQTHTEKHTNLWNSHTHNVQEDPKELLKMFITYLYWRTWKPSGPFLPSQWFQRYWLSHVSLQVKKHEVFQPVPPIRQITWILGKI